MKRSILMMVMGVLGIVMSSCAGTKFVVIPSEEKTYVFEYDLDTVWTKLIFVLNEQELPITTIEKESGIIVTDFVLFDAKSSFGKSVLQIGTLEFVKEGRYRLNILATKRGKASTSVRINAHIEKFSQELMENTYSWKPQLSNGYIEKQIFTELNTALK